MSKPEVTPARRREIIEAFLDHPRFCRESLNIRDKSGRTVPLILTPSQMKLDAAIERMRDKRVPVRVRVLKARQVHFSVGCASELFKSVAFLPGQKAKVYAHLDESTEQLFDYYQQFDETYKPLLGIRKLKRIAMRQGESIDYEGGGCVDFGTAETGRGGRSGSYKYLHLSETAFWRDSAALRTGLLNSVPDLEDTMVIDESTANGMGGPFYEAWKVAEDPNNRSGWLAVFFGWHEHPENTRPAGDDALRLERSLTDEENSLRQRYNLTLDQVNWRRWKIASACEGDSRRFQQEHPADAEEAFLTSGRPRLCMVSLARQPVTKEPLAGELEEAVLGLKTVVRFRPSKDGTGALRIWKMPEVGHRYVIGADIAEGRDAKAGKGTADPDYTVFHVLDKDTGDQIAVFRARIEPAPGAQYCWALMRLYNRAFCCFEINGPGVAFRDELLRAQVPGELLYQNPQTNEYGWRTTTITKQQMISALDVALQDGSLTLRDPQTIHEARVFVYHPDGKVSAQSGEHDDLVMSLALSVQALIRYPKTLETRGDAGNVPRVERYAGGNRYGSARLNQPEPEGW